MINKEEEEGQIKFFIFESWSGNFFPVIDWTDKSPIKQTLFAGEQRGDKGNRVHVWIKFMSYGG